MIVLSQDKNVLVNFDNVCAVRVTGNYIHAYLNDGTDATIASYGSYEKARSVFNKMFVLNHPTVIRMPEE